MITGNGYHNLPQGWTRTTLEDCVDILDAQRIPVNADERDKRIRGRRESSLVPYFGATGQIGWIDDHLFDEELLLVGEDGAPFLDPVKTKAYLINGKSWVNNHAHVLRARRGLTSNGFLCHYLNSFDFHGYVTGTTRLKLSQGPMRKIPILLPPLAEQERIREKIDEILTKLDTGTGELRKARLLWKNYRQAVLKAAVTGELTREWREAHKDGLEPASELLARILKERGERWESDQVAKLTDDGKATKNDAWKRKYHEPVSPNATALPQLPQGWTWATMPQLGELNRGKSKHRPRNDPHLYNGDYPFIQTGDIRQASGLLRQYRQTYSEAGLKQSRLWPKGTLCITIAANIAETAILGFDACFPDSVVGFRAESDSCDTRFVDFFIRTAKQNLERYAPATAQKNINIEILSEIAVPFPPLLEQRQIADEVERILSITDASEQIIEDRLRQAERLRQSIVKQAFEGKLVAQDRNDEPAELLLERIKIERAKREAEKAEAKSNRKRSTKKRLKRTERPAA